MRAGILFILWLTTLIPGIGMGQVVAKKGIFDLRSWQRDSKTYMSLDGTWRFLPDQLAAPEEVTAWFDKAKILRVPDDWSNLKGRKKKPISIGSYALHVINRPLEVDEYALTNINAFSSYRLYLVEATEGGYSAELLIEQGQVSDKADEAIPFNFSKPISFRPKGPDFYLVIQISNYLPFPGGLVGSALFGEAQSIETYSRLKRHETFFVLGMLVLVAIFNIGLFVQRPEDRSGLWLACFALTAGARYVGTEDLLLYLFEKPNLGLFVFSYILRAYAVFLGIASYVAFFNSLFPKAIPSKFVHGTWIYALFYGILLLVIPVERHVPFWALFIFPIGLISLFVLVRLGQLAWHRYPGTWLAAGALTINALTFINDFMVYTRRYDFVYLSQYGMVAFTVIQSLIAGKRFAKAARTAENLRLNLQKEVARQTREIRSMLDNMRQGLFMIHTDLKVMPNYSKNLEDIFEAKSLRNRDALDLLFEYSQTSQEQRSMVRSTLVSSLNDLDINFEVNVDHLLQEFVAVFPNGKRKILAVDWSMICNQDSIVEKILVTIRDVTRLRELEAASAEKQKNLDLIYQIISIEEYSFNDFIESAHYFLAENKRALQSSPAADPVVLRLLFTNMHTLKGIARSYRLNQLTEVIHLTEETYAVLLKNPALWNSEILLKELQSVSDVLNSYISINRDQLGRRVQRDIVSINRQEIHQDVILLEQIDGQRLEPQLKHTLNRVKQHLIGLAFFKPDLLVQEIQTSAQSLANDLGKEVPLVRHESEGIYLSHEAKTLLRNIFIHLVRNSLDHGIEPKEERLQKRKAAEGLIQLQLKEHRGHLEVIYRDDGRGLHLRRLQEIAGKTGQTDLHPQVIAQLIFAEGISTAHSLSEISGRGIGMGAVKRYLEDHGGRIDIMLEAIEGDFAPFAFRLQIPKSLYVAA